MVTCKICGARMTMFQRWISFWFGCYWYCKYGGGGFAGRTRLYADSVSPGRITDHGAGARTWQMGSVLLRLGARR